MVQENITKIAQGIKKLGFGYMRLPMKNGEVNIELLKDMVDVFMQNGFSYFDTAYMYPGSEDALRKTLVERYPRDKFQVATKLQLYAINKSTSLDKVFNTSLKRLGLGDVDYYLLHALNGFWSNFAEDIGAWDFLVQLKEEGKVKHIGFSFHGTPKELDEILNKHTEAEFVQLQINYIDWVSDVVQAKKLYEVARKYDKPIIVMEPVKGGLLANSASPIADIFTDANHNLSTASWAIRFAALLDGVVMVLSGMNTVEQILDNMNTIDELYPFSDDEKSIIKLAIDTLNAIPRIPCTSCGYCLDSCPRNIKISTFIALYNESNIYNSLTNAKNMYDLCTEDGFTASTCIACKKCEERCPQKIPISKVIAEIAHKFDDICT